MCVLGMAVSVQKPKLIEFRTMLTRCHASHFLTVNTVSKISLETNNANPEALRKYRIDVRITLVNIVCIIHKRHKNGTRRHPR